MAIVELQALAQTAGRLLGLDLGEKSIGVAISDVARIAASPAPPIRRRRFTVDAEALIAFARSRAAAALVIGLPLNMDGSSGRRAQSARAFARNLLPLADWPIAFFDERLSTRGVERMLIEEADSSRARRAQVIDSLAATWILQGALERLRAASDDG